MCPLNKSPLTMKSDSRIARAFERASPSPTISSLVYPIRFLNVEQIRTKTRNQLNLDIDPAAANKKGKANVLFLTFPLLPVQEMGRRL